MTELPYVAVRHALRVLLRQSSAEDFMLKLFINTLTPVRSNTAASFTEPTGLDYAPMFLPSTGWTIQGERATYPEQTFKFRQASDPRRIRGYFIVTQHSNILYWAERFADGPYLVERAHDMIIVQPQMIYARMEA